MSNKNKIRRDRPEESPKPADSSFVDLKNRLSTMIGTKEAARILGVCQVRVQQFCREKRILSINAGGRLLMSKDDVVALAKVERRPGRPANS